MPLRSYSQICSQWKIHLPQKEFIYNWVLISTFGRYKVQGCLHQIRQIGYKSSVKSRFSLHILHIVMNKPMSVFFPTSRSNLRNKNILQNISGLSSPQNIPSGTTEDGRTAEASAVHFTALASAIAEWWHVRTQYINILLIDWNQ